MKIKALKSGKFGHPDLGKGFVILREGREYDVDDRMAASMIDCGWGEIPTEALSGKQLDKMKKSELIHYANAHNIEIDHAWTNAEMVAEIKDFQAQA